MGIRLSFLSILCNFLGIFLIYLAVKKLTTPSFSLARVLVMLSTIVEIIFSFRWGLEKMLPSRSFKYLAFMQPFMNKDHKRRWVWVSATSLLPF